MLPVEIYGLLNSYHADKRSGLARLPETGPAKGVQTRPLSAVDALVLLRSLKDEPSVKELLDFVRMCNSRFRAIRRDMSYRNPNHEQDHKDAQFAAGWAGVALLPVALALYAANRSGIGGGMLECGVFKGGSTACMSHVCAHLGVRLYAADSFEGLPHGSENGYYQRGQFLGRQDEVAANVERFGDPTAVSYIKGWFSESLKDFDEALALIFLDTDLYESSRDALENAYDSLSKGGVIFSDGLSSKRDFSAGRLVPGSDEARAVFNFLESRGIPQKASTTGQDYLGLIVPDCADDECLAYSPSFAKTLLALIGNEGTAYPYYLYPEDSDFFAVSEMLADSALSAVDLRDSLDDHRSALSATEKLVAKLKDAAASVGTSMPEAQPVRSIRRVLTRAAQRVKRTF